MKNRPIVLLILDSWGVAIESDGNAISKAKTSNFNRLVSAYPAMSLLSFGEACGLNKGEQSACSNSHLNIGIGRPPYHILAQINASLKDGTFYTNESFKMAIEHANKYNSNIQLFGLLSTANEHSSLDHLYGLLEFFKQNKFDRVFIHLILDGKDVVKTSGLNFVEDLENKIKEMGVGKIASICGRNYAMDRGGYWERTKEAYDCLVLGKSKEAFADAKSALQSYYEKNIYDSDILPTVLLENKKPVSQISENDSLICFNFRGDCLRQLAKALVLADFSKFNTKKFVNLFCVSLSEYDKHLPIKTAFSLPEKYLSLGEILSREGLPQFYLAYNNKFAEVSYYLNGKNFDTFPKMEKSAVSFGPKIYSNAKAIIKNKDLQKKFIKEIQSDKFDFLAANICLADETAKNYGIKETIKAIEAEDKILGEIVEVVLSKNGICLLASGHGGLEEMQNLQTGQPQKENSTNPVPFIIVGQDFEGKTTELANTIGSDLTIAKPVGTLSDIAPTILKLFDIDKPQEMSGRPLI